MNEVGRCGRTTRISARLWVRGAVWATLAAIIQRSKRSEISTIAQLYSTGTLVVESRNFGMILAGTWQPVLSSATAYRQYCFTSFTVAIARPTILLPLRLGRRVADVISILKK